RIPGGPTALAWYKLAWVAVNEGECKAALHDFGKALDHAEVTEPTRTLPGEEEPNQDQTKRPESAQSLDVRRQALIDMTYCYSRERPVKGAIEWFREHAQDRETYVIALSRLARRYEVLEAPDGAIQASRELLRVGPADLERLDDARVLYAKLRGAERWDRVGEDAQAMLTAMVRATRRGDLEEESRQTLSSEFERYARDLLTRAHEQAKKGGTTAPSLFEQVALGYGAYLDTFPNSTHRWDMQENRADVLFRIKRYDEAGRAYAELARILEPGKRKHLTLYDTVVAYQRALDGSSKRTVDRVIARSGLRLAGGELLQGKLPANKERKVKFAIALSWYDEGRFGEAIDQLTAVAWEFPSTKEADAAAHLVLDAYNALEDYQGLMNAGRRFVSAGGPVSAAVRAEFLPIIASAEQAYLDRISLQAAGEDGTGFAVLEEFADKNKGTSLGERALVNAFVAARAVGDTGKMFEVADRLGAEYPKSEQLPGVLGALAQMSSATFDLETAERYLRKAAAVNPERTIQLLVAAGQIAQEYGRYSVAQKAFQTALTAAGESEARRAPMVALAALVEAVETPATVITTLKPLAGSGEPEVLARLGIAYARLGKVDAAETILQDVTSGAETASLEARSRAKYGNSETLLAAVLAFDDPEDIDTFQEYVTLVEITEQSYVGAAQSGQPLVTAAALGRLSFMSSQVARRLKRLGPPPGLSGGERTAVQAALKQRIENLGAIANEALSACARLAWKGRVFNPAVRACLEGAPTKDPMLFDRMARRGSVSVKGLEALRARIGRDPADVPALRSLAAKLLDGGDAHTARVVLTRIAQIGGTPADANLLGIASWQAKDITGALEGFARAADAGLESGRQNLARGLREQGLSKAADRALKNWPVGRIGGRLLGGAR
ncbi:MAG: tetratricopeptide (TPR) repeat protein, partial [Myxococcota bacterium]